MVFCRLLQRQDWFTQEKSAKILTAVIESRPRRSLAFSNGALASDPATASQVAAYGGADPAEQVSCWGTCMNTRRHPRTTLTLPHPHPHPQQISSFVDWLIGQLRRPASPTKSVPVSASILSVILRERGSRQLFLRAGGCSLLPPLLRSSNTPSNSQLLYELCMCVWQMTFLQKAAEALATAGEGWGGRNERQHVRTHARMCARACVCVCECACMCAHVRTSTRTERVRTAQPKWLHNSNAGTP